MVFSPKTRIAGVLVGLLAVLGISSTAMAQEWPVKTITFLNPFPAGGGTDAFARPIAAQLTEQLGKQVIIDNRGGAGGTVGASVAAKAAPDGYTWFIGASHHTIAPSMYKTLDYDIQKSFIPVALLASVPQVLVVNPGRVSARNLKDFIALMNLLAGQVDLEFDGLGTSAPQINAGKLVAIAVAADKRNPAIPNVPTFAEAGLPDYKVSTWYAMFAPAGTPKPIIDKMTAEVQKALNTPKLKAIWTSNGAETPNLYGPAFGQLVAADVNRWAEVVKKSGAKLD